MPGSLSANGNRYDFQSFSLTKKRCHVKMPAMNRRFAEREFQSRSAKVSVFQLISSQIYRNLSRTWFGCHLCKFHLVLILNHPLSFLLCYGVRNWLGYVYIADNSCVFCLWNISAGYYCVLLERLWSASWPAFLWAPATVLLDFVLCALMPFNVR